MRKLVVLSLALILLVPAAPVTAEPHVRTGELAGATWLLPTRHKHRFIWYFGMAMRHESVADGKMHSFVAIGRGKCFRHERRNHQITMCEADRYVRGKVGRDFTMGPLGANARLAVPHRGRKHVIRWSGDAADVNPHPYTEACNAVPGGGVTFTRITAIRGKVFGRELPSMKRQVGRGLALGVLQKGTTASGCNFRSVEIGDDGTLRMTFNF